VLDLAAFVDERWVEDVMECPVSGGEECCEGVVEVLGPVDQAARRLGIAPRLARGPQLASESAGRLRRGALAEWSGGARRA